MRYLSQTGMGTYERCPQKWKLHYIDGHPTKPNRFLNLGSAVHAALEAFYQGRIAEPAKLDEMIAAFEAELEPAAYANAEESAAARADGLRMIRAFHAAHAPQFRPALLVEDLLRFELDGVPVVAKIDRVDKLDGTVRIVDYKSGFRPPRLDEVRQSEQLTLYQVAVERVLGLEVAAVGLYHVPSQTLFEVPAHGPERVEALRRRVLRVARGIEQADFEPRPGRHCSWCDFRESCPAWAHEYPENWEQTPLPPTPSHAEASRLADRFGELKDRIRDLESELADFRAPLEEFFRITGERVAAGDRYAVRATPGLGYRFDDAALRALLEPAGLWEKVLVPDWRAEESLLADPDVPAEIRARMERLAQVEEGWTFRYGPAAAAQADSRRSGHGEE
ncbi:MAG: PD-(D/E)XK nuclease family protein [Gemmatimonadota bacterium]|nr:MAG: PD-(D/E)XK nuclease family protein [Gemmatimonadota bacterium]